jgi:hypothetical protein
MAYRIILRGMLAAVTIGGCVVTMTPHPSFAKTIIVTEEESKLPPPKSMPPPSDRGITRGPKIEIDSEDKESLHAPIHFKLRFKTFGGSAIDLGAFQATYVKDPTVDLTSRIKPFVQPSGIDIPDAELPAGEHFIQFAIKDSEGRAVTKLIRLKIMP